MNGASGFQEVRSSTPDHQQIGSCTSNNINSEQVPGTVSLLTISSISPQKLAQSKKWFLTPFACLSLARVECGGVVSEKIVNVQKFTTGQIK